MTHSAKIHFSITPTVDGLTYQLYEWGFLHDIGLALGYTYFHAGFNTSRSDPPNEKNDIYDFLGVTRHFKSENTAGEFEQRIKIYIPERLIWRREKWNVATLMTRIEEEVTRQAERNKKTLIQLIVLPPQEIPPREQIKNSFGKRSLRTLHHMSKFTAGKRLQTDRAPWRYGPNLYPIYFEQRKIQPWQSRFPPGKIKMAVHIRRGDFAIINTPWGDKIECLEQGLKNRHITVQDFKQFVQQLTSRFDQYRPSTLFFSDGYENTVLYLRKEKKKHKLSDEQVEILSRQVIVEGEHEFKPLEDVESSRTIIGSTSENLFDFIHSCLSANIIITAAYYKFTRKLGSLYFNKHHSPIMIFLHKGDPDLKTYPPIPIPTDKSIFFNVRDPDYATLEKQLKKFLPQ